MFTKHKYHIELVAEPFANLRYRDRTTLILCRDGGGKYVLGTEHGFYPGGIARMIGGGIDKEEKPVEGAIREVKEEIGIDVTPEELIELAQFDITGSFKNKKYKHVIFVYFLNSDKDDYVAGDDVSEIIRYTEEEYKELIKRFFALKPNHIYVKDNYTFSWRDYGNVYGFVHQVTLEEYLLRFDLTPQ